MHCLTVVRRVVYRRAIFDSLIGVYSNKRPYLRSSLQFASLSLQPGRSARRQTSLRSSLISGSHISTVLVILPAVSFGKDFLSSSPDLGRL